MIHKRVAILHPSTLQVPFFNTVASFFVEVFRVKLDWGCLSNAKVKAGMAHKSVMLLG